jgi:hypothetical protein
VGKLEVKAVPANKAATVGLDSRDRQRLEALLTVSPEPAMAEMVALAVKEERGGLEGREAPVVMSRWFRCQPRSRHFCNLCALIRAPVKAEIRAIRGKAERVAAVARREQRRFLSAKTNLRDTAPMARQVYPDKPAHEGKPDRREIFSTPRWKYRHLIIFSVKRILKRQAECPSIKHSVASYLYISR